MGLKLSFVLGGLLILSCTASWFYIQYQERQIIQLKANAQVLEGEIAKQNESIQQYLSAQKDKEAQIAELAAKNQAAQREVSQLRDTFSRHNMDNLALNKPKLIENIVNKGTKKVKEELVAITNPNQFDEEVSTAN